MNLKEARRIWKWSFLYFLLASAEIGTWYSLRFWIQPAWFMFFFPIWLAVGITFACLIIKHILTFLTLLATPPICWLREYLDKKREFQGRVDSMDDEFSKCFEFKRKLEEIDLEFDRTFGTSNLKRPEK